MCIGYSTKGRRGFLSVQSPLATLAAKASPSPSPVVSLPSDFVPPSADAALEDTRQQHEKTEQPDETQKEQPAPTDYRDYAKTTPDSDPVYLQHQDRLKHGGPPPGGVGQPFPLKLHALLDQVEADGMSHIVGWQPHGRAFIVHDTKRFVELIMPQHFRGQSKFASFQRQLNLYNFRRLTAGIDRGGYYHEAFLRGKPFLSHRIVRARVNGKAVRRPACPEAEPNLYAMEAVGVGHTVVSAHCPQQLAQPEPQAVLMSGRNLQFAIAPPSSPFLRAPMRTHCNLPIFTSPPPQPPPSTTEQQPAFVASSDQLRHQQQSEEPNCEPYVYPMLPPEMEPTPLPSSSSSCAAALTAPRPDAATSAAVLTENPAIVSDGSVGTSSSSSLDCYDNLDDDKGNSRAEQEEDDDDAPQQDQEFEEELSKIFDEEGPTSTKLITTTTATSATASTIKQQDADEFFADLDLDFGDMDAIDDAADDVEFGLLLDQAIE